MLIVLRISFVLDVYPFTKDGETESGDILSWIILRTAEKWADELAKDAAKEVQKSLIQALGKELFIKGCAF